MSRTYLQLQVKDTDVSVSHRIFSGPNTGRGIPHIRIENMRGLPDAYVVLEDKTDQRCFRVKRVDGVLTFIPVR